MERRLLGAKATADAKQDDKYLKQVHSQVLQDVLLRLDKAYQAFFKNLTRYPRFKKKRKYNSFTYPQYGGFQLKYGRLVLSRIGAVKFKMHLIPIGTLKRCTIIRDVDQWYCCITTDGGIDTIEKKPIQKAIGIDAGLLNWIALSNGNKIQNAFDFEAHARCIRELQRRLARKKKGSHNREKARIQLAKAWRKVRRRRDDFVHKASKTLADNYDTVVFEKLNISNMVRNHNLAQAIMDAAWGKLRLCTAYKVEGRGGRCLVVNPSGTSQKCSRCSVVVKERLDLSVRTFECDSCGLVVDRDLNAAVNILNLGLERAHAEGQPLLVRQRISKFASRKQEVRRFVSG